VIAKGGLLGQACSPGGVPSPAAAGVLKGRLHLPGLEVLLLRSPEEELHTFESSLTSLMQLLLDYARLLWWLPSRHDFPHGACCSSSNPSQQVFVSAAIGLGDRHQAPVWPVAPPPTSCCRRDGRCWKLRAFVLCR